MTIFGTINIPPSSKIPNEPEKVVQLTELLLRMGSMYNFINISQAAFCQYFFYQTQTVNREKLLRTLSSEESCL